MSTDLGSPLSEETPFKKSGFTTAIGLLIFVSLLIAGAGLIVVLIDERSIIPAVALMGVGGFLFIVSIIAGIVKDKTTLFQVFADGIQIRSGGRLASISYSDIHAVAIKNKSRFANGEYTAMDLEMSLWTSSNVDGPPKHKFAGTIAAKASQHDAFIEAYPILIAKLAEALDQRLEKGERLKGKGFELDRTGLRIGHDSLSYERIGMVGFFDEKVCVWKDGDQEPSYQFEPDGMNARIMIDIVERHLPENSRDGREVPGLGRMLFQKRSKPSVGITLTVLGILSTISVLVFGGLIAVDLEVGIIGMAVSLFFAVLFGLAGVNSRKAYFRCHEKGVAKANMFGRNELEYHEIATFSYSAVRNYYNGAYTGTTLSFTFDPEPGSMKKGIKYNTHVMNESSGDLDGLRNHIAGVISVKLEKQILAGEELAWGPAHLSKDGVRFRRSKLFGKGDEDFLNWDQIAGANMDQGYFHIFSTSEEKSVVNMPVTVPNFFPLMVVFLRLKYPDDENAQNAATEEQPLAEGAPAPVPQN